MLYWVLFFLRALVSGWFLPRKWAPDKSQKKSGIKYGTTYSTFCTASGTVMFLLTSAKTQAVSNVTDDHYWIRLLWFYIFPFFTLSPVNTLRLSWQNFKMLYHSWLVFGHFTFVLPNELVGLHMVSANHPQVTGTFGIKLTFMKWLTTLSFAFKNPTQISAHYLKKILFS